MPEPTKRLSDTSDIFAASGSAAEENITDMPTCVDPVRQAAPSRLRAGERFGDFLILRELGHGGFATVYLAHDVALDRRVALKVSAGREVPGEGRGEGQTLAELEHEHIVQVHAQFTDPVSGKRCLCLQYVPGATLARVIERLHVDGKRPQKGHDILDVIAAESRDEVPFDPAGLRNREMLVHCDFAAAVCRIGRQLAEALQFAHGRGILHCDIKPANVLINPYGRPLLADFNVSVDFDASRPAKSVGGTIAYMSPEQLAYFLKEREQRVDERSDIYSLGMLLFELLTGHLPYASFGKETPSDLLCWQRAFGSSNSWDREAIPPVLERVLRRCLAPAPDQRYANAGELAQALANAFDLLAIERSLPPGGALTAWANAWPVPMLIALTLLPQLLGSAVNIAYNTVEIRLTDNQQVEFGRIILAYNLIAYPIAIFIMVRLVLPLIRAWRLIGVSGAITNEAVDSIRHVSLRVAIWGMVLALAGWLPGGLIFPLALDLKAGPVPLTVYAHFMISFTLSGLIALIYSHFAIQFVILRIIYPRLGNADTYTQEGVRRELAQASRFLVPFQSLATVIPLVGAVLLIAVTGELSLWFRLLVTSLIIIGMIGVGIAVAVTRRLSQIVRLLEGETGSDRRL